MLRSAWKATTLTLNVEGYGGMLCAPWFDRPLSVAGKVMVKGIGDKLQAAWCILTAIF